MKWKSKVAWRVYIGFSILFFYSIAFSQTEQTLASTTQQLNDFVSTIKAGNSLTPEQYKSINEIAKTRQRLFAIEVNQEKDVSQYVISKRKLKIIPKEARQYLEHEIGPLTGNLEVRAAELRNHTEIIQYLLHVEDEIYYWHFTDGAPPHFETGAIVTVKSAMEIVSKPSIYHIVLSHKNVDVKRAKFDPLTVGPQKVLTVLVNFSDKPSDRPWTSADINSLIYTTIKNYFLEASYQQLTLEGQTAGWFVVNVNSNTDCDTLTSQVQKLGDQAAANAGIDVSQYKRKMYIFPSTNSCFWLGQGSVSAGSPISWAWINGAAGAMRTPAHELGHNWGLWHSRLLACNSPISGNCTIYEYGDGTDIMGAARTSHFNAYQKDRLGWLNTSTTPPITTVSSSGTYTIDAFETNNQKPKALKVLKRTGGSDYYYLEFRQGIGFDAELASCGSSCDYTRGVVFHQGNSNNGGISSDLLDMSPGGLNSLVALMPGQRWTDTDAPNGGVTFEVVSADSSGAMVNVTFGNSPPPPPPETKLENGVPVSNLSAPIGDKKYYYIDVPAGKPFLTFQTAGGTGDVDLYVQYGQRPSKTVYQCRPYTSHNYETCRFPSPQPGRYYAMLNAYDAYTGVSLVATY